MKNFLLIFILTLSISGVFANSNKTIKMNIFKSLVTLEPSKDIGKVVTQCCEILNLLNSRANEIQQSYSIPFNNGITYFHRKLDPFLTQILSVYNLTEQNGVFSNNLMSFHDSLEDNEGVRVFTCTIKYKINNIETILYDSKIILTISFSQAENPEDHSISQTLQSYISSQDATDPTQSLKFRREFIESECPISP